MLSETDPDKTRKWEVCVCDVCICVCVCVGGWVGGTCGQTCMCLVAVGYVITHVKLHPP